MGFFVRIDILTLFPAMFRGMLDSSIVRIAIEKKLADVRLSNVRNFTYDRHRSVDDTPYGGGPGMLLRPEPIFRAVEAIAWTEHTAPELLLMTPQGEPFTQHIAQQLSLKKHIAIICGHYEGFDERIRIGLKPWEISIGDYVLSGGEIPAMAIIDAIIRLLPGALGDQQSPESESFQNGLLEYAQYTKPIVWRDMPVPEVLSSGHHQKIRDWQFRSAYERTLARRPDLLEKFLQKNSQVLDKSKNTSFPP